MTSSTAQLINPSSVALICDTHFLSRHSAAIIVFAEFEPSHVQTPSVLNYLVLIRLLSSTKEDLGKIF